MNQAWFTNIIRHSTVNAPPGDMFLDWYGWSVLFGPNLSQAEKGVELLSILASFSTARQGGARQESIQEKEI